MQAPAVGGVEGAGLERQRLAAHGELRGADAACIAHGHHHNGRAAVHARIFMLLCGSRLASEPHCAVTLALRL